MYHFKLSGTSSCSRKKSHWTSLIPGWHWSPRPHRHLRLLLWLPLPRMLGLAAVQRVRPYCQAGSRGSLNFGTARDCPRRCLRWLSISNSSSSGPDCGATSHVDTTSHNCGSASGIGTRPSPFTSSTHQRACREDTASRYLSLWS